MALFADAVASRRGELRGVDNRTWRRSLEMLFGRSVAALARNCLVKKDGLPIPVWSAGNVLRPARVAEHAFLANRPGEIRLLNLFVSRAQVKAPAAGIVADR